MARGRRVWRAGPVPAIAAGGWQAVPRLAPMRRPPVIGLAAYRMVQGVPLQPANAQATVQGWVGVSGSANAPAAFTNLCQTATIPAGTYLVAWSVTLSGTLGANDVNNFVLFQGAFGVTPSVNPDVAGTYPQTPVLVNVPAGGGTLQVASGSHAATAGSVYGGAITGQATAAVQLGPSGLGNLWYPTQITVATTTGITTGTDTSVCNVYLGPQVSPLTLLGTVYGGNGIVAAALPDIQPGQYLIAEWSSAVLGDTAVMNVQGSMDALS